MSRALHHLGLAEDHDHDLQEQRVHDLQQPFAERKKEESRGGN